MDVYQPGAIVLQCGADSLSGDRLGKEGGFLIFILMFLVVEIFILSFGWDGVGCGVEILLKFGIFFFHFKRWFQFVFERTWILC